MVPIKSDPEAQLGLLELQAVDTSLGQLAHRRRNLPEHAELAGLDARHQQLESALVQADVAVSDLEIEQSKAESDLSPVRDRLTRNQQRIADGSVADPKALAGLVDEVEHLKRRISDLEDSELEVMQQLEDATARTERLRREQAELVAQRDQVRARRDEQLSTLDADAAERSADRGRRAAALPTDLLALYDKLRPGHGGVGAAELRQRRCTGCQLEVNAADLRDFAAAAADDVLRCEECGRILIRTDQSGI